MGETKPITFGAERMAPISFKDLSEPPDWLKPLNLQRDLMVQAATQALASGVPVTVTCDGKEVCRLNPDGSYEEPPFRSAIWNPSSAT